ncbi:MAG TPA: hypothetical protein VEV41_10645 [Terriglobales bacterium]|nr:hypothetical protein [Terriglobales bacterium]
MFRESDVAAWWGAIVGTIALGWNIFRAVRLKGRLKVQAMYRVDSTQPHLPPVLTVRVTNVGSKPIMVQGIAIQRKKGSEPSHYFFRALGSGGNCWSPVVLSRRPRTRPTVCFVNIESVDRIVYSIFQRFNLEWKTRTLNLFTQAA